ncbi:putative bifunctional diguanylate cyclase/phosphodiesterase [Rhodopila sp.]|uniref:putative bifunctional diguanylate cyclase/phosphodiesterase n=1 Tax=Rhodopila sp. TaxID=2480087 RepID=UPI002D7F5C03|nr:EAL domain-containing protein [Rhodopila sp.]
MGWISWDHDPSLVVLACVVCLLSVQAGIRLVARDCDDGYGERRADLRLAAGFAAFGAGVWTTMFTALAGFGPRPIGGFDIPFFLLSLLMAAFPAAVLTAVSLADKPAWPAIAGAGLLFCAGLLGIHVLSLRTLMVNTVTRPDPALLVATLLGGSLVAGFGLRRLVDRRPAQATVLLAASAMLTHLGAAAALAAPPIPQDGAPIRSLPALLGGASAILVTILWFAAAQLDRRAVEAAANEARRLKRHVEAGFEGLIFEHGGVITDANGAMLKLSGCDRHSLIGAHLPGVVKGFTLRSAPGQPSEHELLQPDGTTRPVEVLWRNGPEAGGHILAIRDLTREKTALAQLQRLASHDPLTGLPNRDHFEKALAQMLAAPGGGPLGLIYIDLDRFEGIYENFGAKASDQTLVQVARRLAAIAVNATLIARLGRDEFAVLHPMAEPGVNVQALVARLLQDIERPFEADGQTVDLTASAGIALYPEHGTTAEGLVRNAATALRRAKREGRSTWRMFEAEFGRRLHERQTLERDLAAALGNGQLTLHYQTFFNAETLEPAGCEALLRWNHPLRGRIPPAEFISLAEANGLIVPMGKWVLRTACAEAVAWDRPVTVAVNVSPAQFAEADIVGDVASVLAQTGLPPERLELEITETALMVDTRNALRMLRDLKALGVKIAMDDFGTGHSSLGNLRKFPFDKIKIDRSFISDGDDEPGAEAIVQTVIAMGNSLSLTITAEGVETSRQLAMLRSLGCTYVQGYLLARPAPPEQLRLSESHAGWLSSGPAFPVPPPAARRLAVADTG